jgi:hypothetical protein
MTVPKFSHILIYVKKESSFSFLVLEQGPLTAHDPNGQLMAENDSSWFQEDPPSLKRRRGKPIKRRIPIARDRLDEVRKIIGV